MLCYLRQRPDFDLALSKRAPQKHLFPLCWIPPWRMGQPFLNQCGYGVTAYVIARPLTTIVALIASPFGTYKNGAIAYNNLYPYLATINTVAQGWAMYALIIFYVAFKGDMAHTKPFAKVACTSCWQIFRTHALRADPRHQVRRLLLVLAVRAARRPSEGERL